MWRAVRMVWLCASVNRIEAQQVLCLPSVCLCVRKITHERVDNKRCVYVRVGVCVLVENYMIFFRYKLHRATSDAMPILS